MISLYVVTNKKNGKQYVGMTSLQPEQRWQLHCSEAKGGRTSRIFCHALRKYGETGFDWDVVASAVTPEHGAHAERTLIAQLQPAYNMTDGGEGTAGMHPIARARKSQSLVEHWSDPEVHARRSASQQIAQKNVDQVVKGQKISASHLVRAHITSEQVRARVAADGGLQLTAARATRWADPEALTKWDRSFITEEYRERARRQSSARAHSDAPGTGIRAAQAKRWRMHRLRKAVSAYEMGIRTWP